MFTKLWITWWMADRQLTAKALDALAAQARTLAEAQALSARADYLRRARPGWLNGFASQFIRN
jgi:hypothetical protein